MSGIQLSARAMWTTLENSGLACRFRGNHVQIRVMESSHRSDGGLFQLREAHKFSATVDSIPSRYVVSGTTQGLLKFSGTQGKTGGEEN